MSCYFSDAHSDAFHVKIFTVPKCIQFKPLLCKINKTDDSCTHTHTHTHKLNIQKTKIMASGPIASWQLDGETVKQWQTLILGAPKSLQMVTVAMNFQDTCSLEEKLWPI